MRGDSAIKGRDGAKRQGENEIERERVFYTVKILARAELELFFEVEKCVREGARAHVRILSKSYNIFCLFFWKRNTKQLELLRSKTTKHTIYIYILYGR